MTPAMPLLQHAQYCWRGELGLVQRRRGARPPLAGGAQVVCRAAVANCAASTVTRMAMPTDEETRCRVLVMLDAREV